MVVSKVFAQKKGGKVMTATNMCSNFGDFRCSPAHHILTIRTTTNAASFGSATYLFCGLLAPGQLLPCPKETVAYPLPKYLLLYSLIYCILLCNVGSFIGGGGGRLSHLPPKREHTYL